MSNLLRHGDIEYGRHLEKWPSPNYAQFLKIPPCRMLKPYEYIIQINSQTFLSMKCLRVYRAEPGLFISLIDIVVEDISVLLSLVYSALLWVNSQHWAAAMFVSSVGGGVNLC